jgi:hypothetical protein
MNKCFSRTCADVEVVVVVAGDGQVPHPVVVDLRCGAAVGDRDSAVGSLEVLAFR